MLLDHGENYLVHKDRKQKLISLTNKILKTAYFLLDS